MHETVPAYMGAAKERKPSLHSCPCKYALKSNKSSNKREVLRYRLQAPSLGGEQNN